MFELFIALAVLLYALIGCFLVGFLDIDFSEDGMMFFATIFLWPIYIIVFILAIIFRTPIKLGHKCYDKFGAAIDRMFDNLFEY